MDDQGYEVLRGAVEAEAIAAYAAEREAARDGLLARARGGEHVELLANAGQDAGAVDPYAIVQAARRVLLPEVLTAGLSRRFGCEDDAPLLFDAAETAAAAFEEGPYRDATYVALAGEPETLVTVVVALGAAAVEVFSGSQAIETTAFSGRYRHFNPERDGEAALTGHREELAAGLGDGAPERVELAAGDVLALAADTVHLPAEGQALVAHLCPSRVRPGWFAYRPERAKHASFDDGRAWIATQHYDLVDAVTPAAAPEAPPADAQEQEQELERVEDALREHDAAEQTGATQPAPAPGSPPSRRSGGLVDSVRGMLGRRGRR